MTADRGVEHRIRRAPAPTQSLENARYSAEDVLALLHLQKKITYTTGRSGCLASRAVEGLVCR